MVRSGSSPNNVVFPARWRDDVRWRPEHACGVLKCDLRFSTRSLCLPCTNAADLRRVIEGDELAVVRSGLGIELVT